MVSWSIKSAVFFSLSLIYVWGGWFFVLPPLPWSRTPNLCPAWVWGGGGEYGFLTPQVCSCFSPPFSPAPSSFCSQSIESAAVFLGVEASSKSSARGNCFGGASLWF